MRATTKGKKLLAGVIALMMLAGVLFSALFIAAEADHDCAGEDCSVCVCIRLCAQTLSRIGKGSGTQAAVSVLFILLLFSAIFFAAAAAPETPVSKKVRLNN